MMDIQEKVNKTKDALVGFKYKHFKGNIYEVTDIAVNTETEQLMVIYRDINSPQKVWARPYEMFIEEVDHTKYPDVSQKMRFEKIVDI